MSKGGMNKKLKFLLAVILLPLGVLVPALSLESHYNSHINAQPATALEERKEHYRAQLGTELSRAEQERIRLRCSVAQTSIKNLQGRIGDVQTKRLNAYDSILSSLNGLLSRLDAQAFESSDLQTDVDELSSKVSAFRQTLSSYKQAVDDMVIIDCAQDPTTFQAALQSARQNHQNIMIETGEIRTYINNTIKPTLQAIRIQLAEGRTTGGSQ